MAKVKLGTLIYDTSKEEGVVDINWGELPEDVMGLDILSDWSAQLTRHYHKEVTKVFKHEIKTGELIKFWGAD